MDPGGGLGHVPDRRAAEGVVELDRPEGEPAAGRREVDRDPVARARPVNAVEPGDVGRRPRPVGSRGRSVTPGTVPDWLLAQLTVSNQFVFPLPCQV